ncbi:hypothetical protein, conserved [Eimeria necatrix]|uniref:Uncharacterized protein n=1 Tax=Eimeria necatrix TaxID=51315 RepID=U6MLD4_9EIME|nr:hypothetical protein, conserved [Eimeria necatrix]CDJ63888.1 hypothetical protein, conserved [Eimeria necatrix]
MGYDRVSESRRSPSGGRSKDYVGRRSGRADYRSPDRRYRGADSYRRPYRNRSPEYEKYRRRSPSPARYGRDSRAYRSGRTAPCRRSGSRSIRRPRSRSVDSTARNEKYRRNDPPAARFGSRASYLRSKEVNRAPSRSPSRGGRCRSPARGDQSGRRDARYRSNSRDWYRERREGQRRSYVSPEREPLKGSASSRHDISSRGSARRPRDTDRCATRDRSRDRSGSHHGNARRQSPRVPQGHKRASSSERARSHGRNSKWSRSRSRSGSWARKNSAATASGRSPVDRSRSCRRSESRRTGTKAADASQRPESPPEGTPRRSPVISRQEEEQNPTRQSPEHVHKDDARSAGDYRRVGGSSRSSLQSQCRSPLPSRSASRARTLAEASKHSRRSEVHSTGGSPCRSADCPTPDLVSSRPRNAEGKGADSARHSVSRQEKPASKEHGSPKHVEDAVPEEISTTKELQETPRQINETCPGSRQAVSVSRSPSARSRVPDVERDERNERRSSPPRTPPASELPVAEKCRQSCEANALPTNHDVTAQKRDSQAEEQIHEQSELPVKGQDDAPTTDIQRSRPSPLQRRDERPRNEGHSNAEARRPSGAVCDRNVASDDVFFRRKGESGDAHGRAASGDNLYSTKLNRRAAKRRIVTAEPAAFPGVAEMHGSYQELSPRRYWRNPRFPPDRDDRFFPSINRVQPFGYNRWNRLDGEEHHDFPQPPFPGQMGRSVRLVARRNDRNLLISPQQRVRYTTPADFQRMQLHNGIFQRPIQPGQRHLHRTPVPIQAAAWRNRKTAGILGRTPQERRHAAAASSADGKWSHDLFEQLSNEPEKKRRRFNLYGETLERVDD